MRGKLKYLLVLVLILCMSDTYAQNSQTMYFMNLPQNHILNPALRPSNKIYISLPVISGFNINMNNNFVNFSDVFMKGKTNDSVISILHPDYNVDKFLAKIRKNNYFDPEVNIPLLGFGFSVGKDGFVFFDANVHAEGNLVLPGDFFRLALKGNEQFVGSKMDFSSLRASMKSYNEIGVGYSRNITEKLRVGAKVNFLMGITCVSTDNKSLDIAVNNDYSHTLNGNMAVNISGPVTVTMDADNNIKDVSYDDDRYKKNSELVKFLSGKRNKGLGLDIGATYELTERITLSGSLDNIGFIRWKSDVTSLKTNNQFKFSGLSMNDYFNGSKTLDDIGQDMLDSLKNAFKVTKTGSPFTTFLPMSITLGGSYSVTKSLTVGLLSYTRFIEKQMREAVTLSANLNLGNIFSTSLSYTAENRKYDNLGAGLAVRTGVTQFYIITDRIPVVWDKIKNDNSTYPIPSGWNTLNIRIGMNLVFGNKMKEKNDKPMISVQ